MFRLFRIRFFNSDHLCPVHLGTFGMLFAWVCALIFVPAAALSGNYITCMLRFIFALCVAVIGVHLANGSNNMEWFLPGYWKKEFHRAVMHDDWAKIYADALELSKIFEKYAYFYICTDSFHDLPLQQLERALNIFAERNPKYFTEKLIETVLSDAENGLQYTYLVYFNSEGTLEFEKLTDDQIKNDFETIEVFETIKVLEFPLEFWVYLIGLFIPLLFMVIG